MASAEVLIAPHDLAEGLARQNLVNMRRQRHEQPVLGRREMHRRIAHGDCAPGPSNDQLADADLVRWWCDRFAIARGPTENGLDACLELVEIERLGDKVIGAELESEYPIDLLLAGAADDDG